MKQANITNKLQIGINGEKETRQASDGEPGKATTLASVEACKTEAWLQAMTRGSYNVGNVNRGKVH